MKRYYWTSRNERTNLEDDDEYYGALTAIEYYKKAMKATKSPEFKALCLRMAGRCENYRLDYYESGDDNIYYAKLKKEYVNDTTELFGNCYSFEEYFRKGM